MVTQRDLDILLFFGYASDCERVDISFGPERATLMVNTIGDLISQFNHHEQSLSRLLASQSSSSGSELKQLDSEIETTFNAILSAELQEANDVLERIGFLISIAQRDAEPAGILSKVLEAVERDVAFFTLSKSSN